jgi:hypothetical protein
MTEFISLYDHLGRAAGKALGKQVAEMALSMGVKIQTRIISNPSYSGGVCVYPKSFLELYFKAYNA